MNDNTSTQMERKLEQKEQDANKEKQKQNNLTKLSISNYKLIIQRQKGKEKRKVNKEIFTNCDNKKKINKQISNRGN